MSTPLTRQQYDALPEVLTVSEVAVILDTTVVTVRSWAEEGELPGVLIGRVWRFSKTVLERYIAGESTST